MESPSVNRLLYWVLGFLGLIVVSVNSTLFRQLFNDNEFLRSQIVVVMNEQAAQRQSREDILRRLQQIDDKLDAVRMEVRRLK